MSEQNGSGLGGFLVGWGVLGWLLNRSAQRTRQEQDQLRQVYADARGISVEEARLELDARLPKPAAPKLPLKVRRLTHREALSALLEGRFLEACRERVREAEAAAANRAG